MQPYEKMGQFYLGKVYDPTSGSRIDQDYLYPSADLTTHALCVGMTGSGKTGLCIDLLEEAAVDGIPAIIIDPKGDMSNLKLLFPEFRGADFEPWVQPEEAQKKGMSVPEFAEATAQKWRAGLADWAIDPERVAKLKANTPVTIYTPGSNAGRQLALIRSIAQPSEGVMSDRDLFDDYVDATATNLLNLIGVNPDPMASPAYSLISNILMNAWGNGETCDLATLITHIQNPPFDKIGVMPLESFYPKDDRFKLSMQFNNLIASPRFASWSEGEPVDIDNLLYTPEGKAKLSILSLNHLGDQERMFFVAGFLNRMISWMRAQSGTSALRAILYMDEIFGYFPPSANPPSKKPLLTLLKQARAFGLGVMLTTQNPVDLDYKGLSNIGTWFIGRLQTERDRARLLDGLERAMSDQAIALDRAQIAEILSNLPKRTFFVNNVHDDGPELFETRWAMSYLAGPMTKKQLRQLQPQPDAAPESQAQRVESGFTPAQMPGGADSNGQAVAAAGIGMAAVQSAVGGGGEAPSASEPSFVEGVLPAAPSIPEEIPQIFMPANRSVAQVVYRPSLYAIADVMYDDKVIGTPQSDRKAYNTCVEDAVMPVDWAEETGAVIDEAQLERRPKSGAGYLKSTAALTKKSAYTEWSRALKDHIYNTAALESYRHPGSKTYAAPGETLQAFSVRMQLTEREMRDQAIANIRAKYEKKIAALAEKVRKAELAVDRERSQAEAAKMNTFINIGSTILDSFLGKKRLGKSTMSKAASTARSVGRSRQQMSDIDRAEASLKTYQSDLEAMEAQLQAELDALSEQTEANVETVAIKPKKTGISVRSMAVLWLPYEQNILGELSPLFDTAE